MVRQLLALLQQLLAPWELELGMLEGTGAHAAAVAVAGNVAAVVARGAAGEQEQAECKLSVEVGMEPVASLPVAEGRRLHSLGDGWCSKAVSRLLAATRVQLDMLIVHALGAVPVLPGPCTLLQTDREQDAFQQALKEGEVHRQVVGEEFRLVVTEALRKFLAVREGSAGCLHAQRDHTSPAVPAAEAQRYLAADGALAMHGGMPADIEIHLAGTQHTVRLHHERPHRTGTTSRRPRAPQQDH